MKTSLTFPEWLKSLVLPRTATFEVNGGYKQDIEFRGSYDADMIRSIARHLYEKNHPKERVTFMRLVQIGWK